MAAFQRKRIQHLVIDSTGAHTELCTIGKLTGTDKSPYNEVEGKHCHPYTAVYDMLFAPLRGQPIRFAEIGIAGGNSVAMWWNYFRVAADAGSLHFFDRCPMSIETVQAMQFPVEPRLGIMDVGVDGDVRRALEESAAGELYDVVLDDSSHEFDHQIRIIKEAWPLIRPGGYLIIEDVYRTRPEADYEKQIGEILDKAAAAYFVVCNHEERYSPGWNNDKLLVLVKA